MTTTDTRHPSSPTPVTNPFSTLQGFDFDRTLRFARAAFDTSSASVGQTPKDVVWRRNKAKLYRYRGRTETVNPTPLLLVHSLVSKSYILDLIPGNSFVEYLVGEGFDVYLTDWGTPSAEDKRLTLEDYVLDYLPKMVDAVLRESGATELSMLGYCMGGLLTLLYAATHADGPARNIISLATPIDFANMGLQGIWGRHMDVDRLVDTYGNIPAALIKSSFRMLKPASEFSPVRLINLWQNADSDKFVEQFRAFDRWTQEHIDFPGETFRQTTKALMQGNQLVRGGLQLGGRSVSLSAITQNFLAVAAESDHIVPLAATNMQLDLVSSADKTFITLPGGHVGLAAGRKARATLWPRVAEWLTARTTVEVEVEVEQPEYSVAAD